MTPQSFLDDIRTSPVRRWLAMDEIVSCLDRVDRCRFLDRVTIELARLIDSTADADAWSRAPELDDEALGRLLDEVGPLLSELWAEAMDVIVVDESDSTDGTSLHGDPFLRPTWWPFELTGEDRIWRQRRDRIVRVFHELLPVEQAEVLAATFAELRRTRSWAPDVERFFETGAVIIDTTYFVIPLLEKQLVEFGLTDATWADLS